jgi:hypothetical protein
VLGNDVMLAVLFLQLKSDGDTISLM